MAGASWPKRLTASASSQQYGDDDADRGSDRSRYPVVANRARRVAVWNEPQVVREPRRVERTGREDHAGENKDYADQHNDENTALPAAATSVDQIVAAAGLTKGAIYSNFGSKEELVLAVIEENSTFIDVSALFDSSLSLEDQLRHLGRSAAETLRGASRQRVLLDRAVQAYVLKHPKVLHRRRAATRQIAELGGAVLDELAATQGRELPLPGHQLVQVIVALTRGMIETALHDPRLADAEHFADAFALLAGAVDV